MPVVETSTPPGTPIPIGPYSHIAKVGSAITIGGVAGVDPSTDSLAGPDVRSQAHQILHTFSILLDSVGSDLDHVVHVTWSALVRPFRRATRREQRRRHRPRRPVGMR